MNHEIKDIINKYETTNDFTHYPLNEIELSQAEKELGVILPIQYKEFLNQYGQGGIDGIEVLGFGANGAPIFVEQTKKYRKYGLSDYMVMIENCDEWIYCINCNDGSIISWSQDEEQQEYADFDEYILDRLNDAVDNM